MFQQDESTGLYERSVVAVLWFTLWALFTSALPCVVAYQLPTKIYTTADGLAGNRIDSIFQDSRGFIWIATSDGLSRFDGYRFLNYTVEQGLPENAVSDFRESRRGDYWLGNGIGVYRFDPRGAQRFIRVPFADGRDRTVNLLYEDRAGRIWCGAYGGLFRLEGQVFRPVAIGVEHLSGDGRIITSLVEGPDGSLWVGTGAGLYRRHPSGRVNRFAAADGLPEVFVTDLAFDHQGRFWVATRQGLCLAVPRPDDDSLNIQRVYTTRDGLAGNRVDSLLMTPGGKLWVGAGSLHEFVGGKLRAFGPGNGIVAAVYFMLEDRQGNLWIGTDGVGLIKVSRNGFTSYGKADGLPTPTLVSMFENQRGEMCGASRDDGDLSVLITRFDGQQFHTTKPAYPSNIRYFGWGDLQIALQDHAGEWWIGTGQGLCRFPRVKNLEELARRPPLRVYTVHDGLAGNNIFRVSEDSHGDIWVGTIGPPDLAGGVAQWNRNRDSWHLWREIRATPSSFCEDGVGNLWIGFFGAGVMRFRDGHFTAIGEKEGLHSRSIRQIFRDRVGRIWIGTSMRGLLRVDHPADVQPRMVAYTTVQGLSSNRIEGISEDRWGRLYIATALGVDRLDVESGWIQHYTTADGLAKGEVQLGFSDREGSLWIAAQQGLSRWTPEPENPTAGPPILFTGLRIAGQPRRISDLGETQLSGLELKPDQNQLQVEFVGLDFAPGETLHYQYMLERTDHEWSAPTDQRTVNYASLRSGSYRFLVRAINSQGAASTQPAILTFKILPPLWQRWWVLALIASAGAGIIFQLHRLRVTRLVELERIRHRIATDLHDDIGASLSHIAVLSEVARVELTRGNHHAEEPLTRIAGVSRELVDSMSEIVWAVNPHKDRLRDLTQHMREFAGDVLVAGDIKFDFNAPESTQDIKLGMDARRQIFLIFKECVHNIVQHSGCTKVDAEFKTEGDWLVLRVSDNGHGFQPTLDQRSLSGHGHGLKNMDARAKAMDGRLKLESLDGQGVTLILQIPLDGRGVRN